MINILIPIAGNSPFFEENQASYPKPLFEIKGLPMIQRALETFDSIQEKKRFIFVVKKRHCDKYHLDNTLRLLTENSCEIVVQDGDTKGAVCTCLLAIEKIDNSVPLIVSNGDQIIDVDMQDILDGFKERKADAGVITFDSVHPQWSYAKVDHSGLIVEVAEKNPISRNAIAGFYYYSRGSFFIEASMATILKGAKVNDLFYISPSMNELVLDGKKVVHYSLSPDQYHSFYSLDRVRDYERRLGKRENGSSK
ncbi:MAG: glycosyltransferase family 2 protein [Bdellovibrionales bacterium]|nr:glycosyltransferase family 2 protein [Bdellovibrionales bacterium]